MASVLFAAVPPEIALAECSINSLRYQNHLPYRPADVQAILSTEMMVGEFVGGFGFMCF